MFLNKYVLMMIHRTAERTNNAPMEIKEQESHLAISQVDLIAVSVPSINTSLPEVKKKLY